MATSRFADIYRKEVLTKNKGVIGGLVSAGGKRLREKMDIRNALFSGGGIGSTIGQKIFGKGYNATPRTGQSIQEKSPSTVSGLETLQPSLDAISLNTKITAKNSMMLPMMGRDMNIMRQNIVKLVKLNGGTASTKVDAFFTRAKDREGAYEAQLAAAKKPEPVSNKPVTEKEKSGGILSTIGLIFAGLMTFLKGAFGAVSGVLGNILSSLPNLLSNLATSIIGGFGTIAKALMTLLSGIPSALANIANLISRFVPFLGTLAFFSTLAAIPIKFIADAIENWNSLSDAQKREAIKDPGFFSGGAGSIGFDQSNLPPDVERGGRGRDFSKTDERRVDVKPPSSDRFNTNSPSAFNLSALPKPEKVVQVSSNADRKIMADLIFTRFKQAGFSDIQAKAAVANAYAESRLNPLATAETAKESSYGLFQMNTKGGLGTGYTAQQLYDPETNIKLAIDAAKKSKAFTSATSINEAVAAFVNDVERPADKAGAIQTRQSIAANMDKGGLSPSLNENLPSTGSIMSGYTTSVKNQQREQMIPKAPVPPIVNVQAPPTPPVPSAPPPVSSPWNEDLAEIFMGRSIMGL